MNVGLEFESKMQLFDDLKVYGARDIMFLCGYTKWERFHGAIIRAVESQANDKFIEKNFFFITHQTAGRPKEDVLMTLEGVAQVLDKCDERKEEVNALYVYIKGVLDERRNALFETKSVSRQKRMTGVWGLTLLALVIVSVGIYLYFFHKLYTQSESHLVSYRKDISGKQLLDQKPQQDEIDTANMIVLDKKIRGVLMGTASTNSSQESILPIPNSETQSGSLTGSQMQGIQTGVVIHPKNAQEGAITNFFGFGKDGKYRDACGLMDKKLCNSGSKNLTSFEYFWKNTRDGVDLLSLTQSKIDPNTYCVKYAYHLKNDLSPDAIVETFHFTMSEDNLPVIIGRYCEAIHKGDRVRQCPVRAKTLHCEAQ